MSVNWHRLTRYPHHNDGRPELYAMRQAMLARLNQIEGIFNRLKNGLMLGAAGGNRNRILDRGALEAAFSLGCLSMTALSLAQERVERGLQVGPITSVNAKSAPQAQVLQFRRPAAKPTSSLRWARTRRYSRSPGPAPLGSNARGEAPESGGDVTYTSRKQPARDCSSTSVSRR